MFSSIRAGSAQIASGRTRDSLLWESEVVYDSAWPTSWLRAKGKPVPLGGDWWTLARSRGRSEIPTQCAPTNGSGRATDNA